MVDPDDITAWQLEDAFRDFWWVANQYPDPDVIFDDWVRVLYNTCAGSVNVGVPTSRLVLLVTRHITEKARRYL